MIFKKKNSKKVQSLKNRIIKLLFKLTVVLVLFSIFQVACLKYINPFLTPNTAWEWTESLIEKNPKKRPVYIWTDIDSISPHLRQAVLAAEDQRFLTHNGFDINEIKQALKAVFKTGKLRGASTISMQTARSVFWISSKSVLRKMVEAYYTVLIELIWDKKRILEMYLNTVDWGTHITGAEAAAQQYFSIQSKNLTMQQAALMTAILPNPHKWSIKNPTPYIKKRQIQIMRTMKKMPLL